jgi:hypothetical protein
LYSIFFTYINFKETPFSAEDVAGVEIISVLGALSLYWCQGIGKLHHQINKNISKMDQLEKMVHRIPMAKKN